VGMVDILVDGLMAYGEAGMVDTDSSGDHPSLSLALA
jgi:hypothetical protein